MSEDAEPKKKRGTKVYPIDASNLYIDDPKSNTKSEYFRIVLQLPNQAETFHLCEIVSIRLQLNCFR